MPSDGHNGPDFSLTWVNSERAFSMADMTMLNVDDLNRYTRTLLSLLFLSCEPWQFAGRPHPFDPKTSILTDYCRT